MTDIPTDTAELTGDQLAALDDGAFFANMNRSWGADIEQAEARGDAEGVLDGHFMLGGFNRLRAGQATLEDAVAGIQRTTADGFQRVTARQNATDAEVNRLRAFLQSYDGPLSWLVDGACVAIIVGASILYLKWMDVDLTLGNLGLVIMADIVLICVALAFTSHIRRLPDPPALAPQGGNGAGQPQQPAPAAPAAPAAATQQLPAVPLPPPPPPSAAPPQANP